MIERKIKMSWAGKPVAVLATMDLAHDIESIINVPSFVLGMNTQTAKMTDCARIVGATLRAGEMDLSDNDVYEEICNAELGQILTIIMEILQKVFPMFFVDTKKKPTATRKSTVKKK